MSTTTAIDKFRRALATGDHTNMAEIYAPDALLDVNVPEWHFQLKGPKAIERQLDEWHPAGPKLVKWQERRTEWGAIVELALWEGENHELYSRSIHVFDLMADRITHHVMYCTGDCTRDSFDRAVEGLLEKA